ncbi:MAG TPA: hypothetical protein HA237_04175 [Candidatus Diapherotrites archaeon]|uniref:Uncharacterized protein n=1 Tax=Candidatus Iainarchaeum sp. TaxID=3101447 RepID=A0A7J4IUN6_9ARCH|nr:hypothetical protein [Candidatus Diapherotrites archaeon]
MEKFVKTKIFFKLSNVLLPGSVLKNVDSKKVEALLQGLKKLEEKNRVELFVILGQKDDVAKKKLAESGLNRFFKKENIFCVTKDYIQDKAEFDRDRHLKALEEDPHFRDDYFKVSILKKIVGIVFPADEIIFIGHDLLTDGFYLREFVGVDVAFVKKALSERNEKSGKVLKGLYYVDLDINDFRKLLLGKKPKPDYRFLQAHIYANLKKQLFGDKLMDAIPKKFADFS